MTSHNDQIRALIAEIDATLEKPSNFLGRLSGEEAKNRDTLEHLRGYLLKLQNNLRRSRISNHPVGEDLAALLGEATLAGVSEIGVSEMGLAGAYDAQMELHAGPESIGVVEGEAIQDGFPLDMVHGGAGEDVAGGLTYGESADLIQRLGRDLEQLRAGLMSPLQAEVNQLQQQRQALSQAVQQLQLQHSSVQSEQLLQEFIQTLMTRLQERLVVEVTAQISQALQGMPQINGNTPAALPGTAGSGEYDSGEAGLMNGIPLDQLQARTDVLLSNLDITLKTFAQTLDQNVQAYQRSLDQGLDRINRMGGQGEAVMAELVNRLADQMEAQGSIQWDELGTGAPTLSIGGESPMGRAGFSVRQLSSRGFEHNSIALDGPELTLDSLEADDFEAASDQSTSSAGIARRRILAAQSSESRAQQSLELDSRRQAVRAANSLEDFYASVGAPEAQQRQQKQAMAVQNRASLSRPGAVKGHYRNLEDALFDGIPEGSNPWARSAGQSSSESLAPSAVQSFDQSTGQTQRRSQSKLSPEWRSDAATATASETYPPQSHRIQSLTDLVDRRFDDFGKANDSAQKMPEAFAAFYGDRSARTRNPAVKKKPFLSRIHPRKSA